MHVCDTCHKLCNVAVSLYALTHRVYFTIITHITHTEVRDKNNQTPLDTACLFGHTEVVKFLVEEAKCNIGE